MCFSVISICLDIYSSHIYVFVPLYSSYEHNQSYKQSVATFTSLSSQDGFFTNTTSRETGEAQLGASWGRRTVGRFSRADDG